MRQRWLGMLIAALALALPASAQDETPAESSAEAGPAAPAPATPATPATPASPDAPGERVTESAATEPGGASESRRAAAGEDDDFVPSEETLPDEQVVFPVDI